MQPRTGLGKIEKIGIIQEAPMVIAHEVCRVRTSYLLLALVHGLLQSWAFSINALTYLDLMLSNENIGCLFFFIQVACEHFE